MIIRTYSILFIRPKMFHLSRYVLLKLSEKTSPQKLFPSDCITLLYILTVMISVLARGKGLFFSPMTSGEFSLSFHLYTMGSNIQGDQLYVAVCFQYLVKRDLASVLQHNSVTQRHFLQGTRTTLPCLSGRDVLQCHLKAIHYNTLT